MGAVETNANSAAGEGRSAKAGFALGVPGLLLLIQVVVLVLFQGGYFGAVVCVCGIASWITFLCVTMSKKTSNLPLGIAPLFLVVPVSYFIGLCLSGVTYYGLSETFTWLAIAGVAFLATQVTSAQRGSLFDALAIFGVAYAAFGLLCFVGLLPLDSMVRDGRLEMTFQYANALATFMALSCVLCVRSQKRPLKILGIVPALAFLAAQSGGSCLAVLICLCGFLTVWFVRQKKVMQQAKPSLRAAITLAAMIALAIMLAFVAFALLPERAADAASTFGERLLHIRDGLTLLASGPIFGIGPDKWQFLYPYIQTAQYHVSVVHCSWLQIALDGGLLALCALFCAFFFGARKLLFDVKNKDIPEPTGLDSLAMLACLAILGLHSFIDFDLQFGALAALLIVFLASSQAKFPVAQFGELAAKREPLTVVLGAIASLVCLFGAFCSFPYYSLNLEINMGNYATAAAFYEESDSFHNDETLQTFYLQSLLASGQFNKVDMFYESNGIVSDRQALYVFEALQLEGETAEAAQVLCSQLALQPYNAPFYQEALDVIGVYGLDEAYVGEFDSLYQQFNERASAAIAAGLPNQVTV